MLEFLYQYILNALVTLYHNTVNFFFMFYLLQFVSFHRFRLKMEEELATAGTSKSGDPSTERNEEEDGEEYSSGEEGESGTGKDLRPDLERILL